MQPRPEFLGLPRAFWGYVRAISQGLKYSKRKSDGLNRYDAELVAQWVAQSGFAEAALLRPLGDSRSYLDTIVEYMNYRAQALEDLARPHFMNRAEAKAEFLRLYRRLKPKCLLPENKQKGEKRHKAYLTCIINMLTEASLGSCDFDQDPQGAVVVERDGAILRTLSRRMDGVFPTRMSALAVWEVKEYYGTTTFGSRVADGVYETLLDGYELLDLKADTGIHIRHYLAIDDRFTWWESGQGRPYLCRIVDALHMGLLDEVLFGREVVERWPQIVAEWGASMGHSISPCQQ